MREPLLNETPQWVNVFPWLGHVVPAGTVIVVEPPLEPMTTLSGAAVGKEQQVPGLHHA